MIDQLRAEGLSSLRQLARALNERRFRTPRGGVWHATSVKNLLERSDRILTDLSHRSVRFRPKADIPLSCLERSSSASASRRVHRLKNAAGHLAVSVERS